MREVTATVSTFPDLGAPRPATGFPSTFRPTRNRANPLSDSTNSTVVDPELAEPTEGSSDDTAAVEALEAAIGEYTPRQIVEDDLSGGFAEAIDATMVQVEDGQLVRGTVVKIDKDEVLLDIGFKSEGVIPARELSIRNDVDPSEIVSLGEALEAMVLTKEDKEGRLVLSKKRAQYERAWGAI